MMSRIERVRRAALIGTAANDQVEEPEAPRAAGLPAVVPAAARVLGDTSRDPAAAFAAQLIGQDGQKRGLRAGPAMIGQAQGAYNRIEWSGSKDRRARKGRTARTEV